MRINASSLFGAWTVLATTLLSCVVSASPEHVSPREVFKADIRGKVVTNNVLQDINALSPQTRLMWDFGKRSTWVRMDGSFVLHQVEEGAHVLEVLSSEYYFEPIYISLTNTSIHLQPYHPARLPVSTQTPSLPYPIELIPLGKIDYYEPVQGLQVLGMLKSPMVLLMLGTGLLAMLMPKLLSSMDLDPEEAAELAKIRQQAGALQEMDWGEKLAGVISGASSGTHANANAILPQPTPAVQNVRSQTVSSSGSGGGGGVKRRKGRS